MTISKWQRFSGLWFASMALSGCTGDRASFSEPEDSTSPAMNAEAGAAKSEPNRETDGEATTEVRGSHARKDGSVEDESTGEDSTSLEVSESVDTNVDTTESVEPMGSDVYTIDTDTADS